MTKEEKIQEAYGVHWELVEGLVRKDGSLSEPVWRGSEIDIEYDDFSTGYFRPKSLQGIEDNNGWVKIESESDLPKEPIQCIVCLFDGKNYIEGNIKLRTPELIYSLKQDRQITHYKPTEKPKPPIY